MEFNRCPGCMELYLGNPCPHCGFDVRKREGMEYALQPNTILAGKYMVGRVLGQGGFGITYLGWDLTLERRVAIKEYYPSGCVSRGQGTQNLTWYATEQADKARKDGMEMFLKEARKMVKVDSIPGIVRVLELFQENGTAYIVMEFVEGETLKTRLQKTGPLPWSQVNKIFEPAIHAMAQVHRAGLVHRDLSPDNLMLLPNGDVKILDLGAAKDLNINTGVSSMQVAKSGFSPLEQYTQRGNSGPWTDVYAMAATIYYAITGKLPQNAVDRLDHDTLSWTESGLLALPPAALAAMEHAMAVQASDRIQTMDELEQRLFYASASQAAPTQDRPLEVASMRKTYAPLMALAMILIGILLDVRLFLPSNTGIENSESIRGEVTSSLTEALAAKPTASTVPKETEPVETLPVLSIGSSRGNHYSSSFLGIQCTLDDSWTFLSDAEIRERNNLAADLFGEEYQSALEATDILFDMAATNANGVDTVAIVLEKLSGTNALISESGYANISKDNIADTLRSSGFSDISIETTEITFAGEPHAGISVSAFYSGNRVFETCVCVKRGNYMAGIVVCTWFTDSTIQVLDCFVSA